MLTNSKYDTKSRVKAAALRDKMKSFNFVVMLVFMKNAIGKTMCLTTDIQSINMNIIDTIDSFKATISTLEHIRNDNDGLENQVHASKSFWEQYGTDPDTEYNRHYRQRKKPRRIDDNPETAANLCLVNHYRKEFVAALDAKIGTLKANLEAVTNILQPVMTLLQPPYNGPVDKTVNTALNKLCDMLSTSMRPDADLLHNELTTFRCHLEKPQRNSISQRRPGLSEIPK